MIKGIYNENEFYTNHYWSSKFFDDLASKTQTIPDLKTRANTIKELGDQYWDLIEGKDASKVEHTEQFVQFYQNLLKGLGYSFDPKKRQTVEGLYYSVATEVKQDSKSHLLIALTESNESGSFESLPLELVKLNKEDEDEAEDRDLAEITSEELDSETGPKWFVVGALDNLHLIQRGKWSYGRFIRVNLSEIFAQKDDKAYTTLLGLFSKEILAPESGISIHEELDDNSHRHAFAVTTELREGVRESIELLINEMIYAKKEAHQEYLKKDKDADEYAKELTHDALFYVYRLIFLLFLESQGDDSELLPLKSEIYRHGYSLEKLLEIAFKQIHEGTQEYEGTFIQESLERIFDLIFNGFVPQRSGDFLTENLSSTGFLVKGLKSDLFDPAKVKHLKGVSLRNGVLQRMLQKLSMADIKEGKKTRKARVSYANLGINQLGAVYEGLLSYTGFFAKEDLYELTQVKKGKDDDGDSSDDDDESSTKATKVDPDKIYLAPKSLVEKYKKDKKYKLTDRHFVLDKETGEPVRYKKGSFIFRMAGRDRQKLASFYTPESLTKCTVKYALKVLFENKKTLEELRKVKILEPAMGSGAFLNEAVNQLADRIIELEVKENPSTLKTPKDRQKRLWEIKYDLISNNVYGVDLNPTAIELARFSLWLNCIGAGEMPPKLVTRLKIGNSLIGARFIKNADGFYPWLMLDQGMIDYGKKLSEYDANSSKILSTYREKLLLSELQPNDSIVKNAQRLAEKLYEKLLDKDSANDSYRKLKLCCDIWSSLFFVNKEDIAYTPKTHYEFLELILSILKEGDTHLSLELKIILSRIVNEERFFHWDLEFYKEINEGGFDLILGNPPWVAVEWQDALYVSDLNIIPLVFGLNAAKTREFVKYIDEPKVNKLLATEFIRTTGYSKMLSTPFYSLLEGISKNTYKAFDVLGLHLLANSGSFGIIQEDGILDDEKATRFRSIYYSKAVYHFQFYNQKNLFSEVDHNKRFSINIFTKTDNKLPLKHIGNLILPSTIDMCFETETLKQDVPLIKDENGNWETRGHKKRIISITNDTLRLFTEFLQTDSNYPVLLNLHSKDLLSFIDSMIGNSIKISNFLAPEIGVGSEMLHETGAQDQGLITASAGLSKSVDELILSGPNINNLNPFFQQTKANYVNKMSYENVITSDISSDFRPRTLFKTTKENLIKIDSKLPLFNGKPYRSHFRLINRGMININNERCTFMCIIPPGVSHIGTMSSYIVPDLKKLLIICGFLSSLVTDANLRLRNKLRFLVSDFEGLSVSKVQTYHGSIARRTLALNGLTEAYGQLWEVSDLSEDDSLMTGRKLLGYGQGYSQENSLRDPLERSSAALEIDALVGLSFGINIDALLQVYETLFPILAGYDKKNKFNRKAKLYEAYNFFKKRGY